MLDPTIAVAEPIPKLRPMSGERTFSLGAFRRAAGPFVIIGGEPDTTKLRRLRADLSIDLDWIGIDRAWSLVARIGGGTIRGIVQLEGLVSHAGMRPVLRAARRRGVPVVYARRGGLLALRVALRALMGER